MAQFDGFLIDEDEGILTGAGAENPATESGAGFSLEGDAEIENGSPAVNSGSEETSDGNMISGTI